MTERILAGMLTAIHQQELPAKPAIDILLEVESLAALDGLNDRMHDMRSTPRGENGIAGRRYYIKGNGNHAFTAGSEQAIRHLVFRDYLRKHHDVAQQYAAIKCQAAEDSRQNPAAYGRLKNEFVQRHEQLALRWPGWPQEKPQESGLDGRIHISPLRCA
ncbi:GrpB family protein [Serratia marcescens]|nr:GrpB family protein [Serratia marcescens]HEJ6941884.1 GrpB family protein [Serratia marcescens]HEJ9147763.1 GrpB family protein [Serratia marcescens]